MKSATPLTTILIVAPVAALIAIAAIPPVIADTTPSVATTVDSKALFTQKCSACHNLPDPTVLSYTRPEWRRTVDKMLNRYKASETISPSEADQIVDYLATFAPKVDNRPPTGDRQWSSEEDDVWFSSPNRTVITNFEDAGALGGLTRGTDGDHAKHVWKLVSDGDPGDGTVVSIASPAASPGSFALLVNPLAKGADIDVKVRFKIVRGDVSPAVGVAVALQDSSHYDVVRYNRKTNDLSLIEIAGAAHTTLQNTPVDRGASGSDTAVSLDTSPAQWHTLRVQVRGGHIRGWIDSYKRINTPLTNYMGGSVALWSQGDTTAEFDDWNIDLYDPLKPSAQI